MQPLDDDELRSLLQEWRAPHAPANLENRVLMAANPPWFKRYLRWLATGSIRVPAPVCIGVGVLLLALAFQALQAPKLPAGKCVAWAGAGAERVTAMVCSDAKERRS